MPTRGAETNGGGMVTGTRHVADHAVTLAKLELKLALTELKDKAAALGLGVALLVGAAVLALFGLGFALAASAAALATALSTWLALLIVGCGGILLAGALGLAGLRAVRRGVPPVPEKALEEARRTAEAVKSAGGR